MRYLVTGGKGFVGAYVVRELVNAGHQVTVLDLVPNREFLADVVGRSVPEAVEVVTLNVFEAATALDITGNGRWSYAKGSARAVAAALKVTRCPPGLAA